MGRQAADAVALRAAAGGGTDCPPIWPWLHPLAACKEAAETPWGGLVDSLLGLGTGLVVGRIAEWLGERFTAIRRPGHQILGEALVIGVVLGWQAVVVLAPLAMVLEELSRIAGSAGEGALRRGRGLAGAIGTGLDSELGSACGLAAIGVGSCFPHGRKQRAMVEYLVGCVKRAVAGMAGYARSRTPENAYRSWTSSRNAP